MDVRIISFLLLGLLMLASFAFGFTGRKP